jgi:hypothetical protein
MSQETRQPGSASDAFQKASAADSSRLLAARRHGRSVREERKDGEAPREREVNLGGLTLQLHVHGSIPGYKLVWENDDNGAIENRLHQGFDFVLQSELNERSAKMVPDEEISSVISRFVKGTRNDGQALRAYLLKLPEEQWAELENQRYVAADEWDRAIRQQAEHPDEKAGMRSLKSLRSKVDTRFSKEYQLGERAVRRDSDD